jgi:hypothetical protein
MSVPRGRWVVLDKYWDDYRVPYPRPTDDEHILGWITREVVGYSSRGWRVFTNQTRRDVPLPKSFRSAREHSRAEARRLVEEWVDGCLAAWEARQATEVRR